MASPRIHEIKYAHVRVLLRKLRRHSTWVCSNHDVAYLELPLLSCCEGSKGKHRKGPRF